MFIHLAFYMMQVIVFGLGKNHGTWNSKTQSHILGYGRKIDSSIDGRSLGKRIQSHESYHTNGKR